MISYFYFTYPQSINMSHIILPGWVRKYYNLGYEFDELVDVAILMAKYTNEVSANHYLRQCFEISGKTKTEFLQHNLRSNEDKKRELTEALAEDLLDLGENAILLKLIERVFTPRNNIAKETVTNDTTKMQSNESIETLEL